MIGRTVMVRARVSRALACVGICAVTLLFAAPALARPTFDPAYVLSDAKLRDAGCMSRAQIQTFLDSQPGSLKSLVTADHNGENKRAADIIYEACTAWTISPKVMLALLQKENSLITNAHPTARALSRAVGAGCPNSVDNRYPGFGPQIWNGARMLDGYGEGKTTSYIPYWSAGRTVKTAEGTVTPRNVATFKLYTYNPVIGADRPYGDLTSQAGSLHGNANLWDIYWRWFGDPLGGAGSTSASNAAPSESGAAPQIKAWRPSVADDGPRLSTTTVLTLLAKRSQRHTHPADSEAPVYRFYLAPKRSYVYLESKNLRDWLLTVGDPAEVRPAGVSLRAMR